ncbi:MAG: hypothetical protein A2Y17_06500 [Clostridiales bacterium GWF2_38_85]|nr:MAG: hypothetical protein A2Y17_06500 [Clostridiales bacterium GWF2_38_85]HBL84496.1 hypothetical protein [Clostridiales bacterium]
MNTQNLNLDILKDVIPKISKNKKRLIMPNSPFEGYYIEIYGTDNIQTVDIHGNVYLPLIDTIVNIIYKVVDINNENVFIKANFNTAILIKGRFKQEQGDNETPEVLPTLREWKGGKETFVLQNSATIVINNKILKEKAGMLTEFFIKLLNIKINVEERKSKKGDICLDLNNDNLELGDEGYYLKITPNRVFISSSSVKGILYGGITVLQIMYTSDDKRTLPSGIARDYPKYCVRSIMLDIARAWIPLQYLVDITKYMAYFKLNNLHLHINDWGGNGYEAFRLESDFEGLAADDGYYTKDEYRAYQKLALKYNIEIVTEIDTPAHSKCFKKINPVLPMINDTLLDIRKPEILEFTKKLIDEYITGEDPVFTTRIFDIGTDEFPREYSKEMRVYCDELIRYINEKGGRAQLWASFGGIDGYNGDTAVCGKARASYAAPGMQDYEVLLKYGFDVINAIMFPLYIVPGGNWNFADYLDYECVYKSWEANWFDSQGEIKALLGDPQFIGAKVCLWNDLYNMNSGFSIFDIFDRLKGGIVLISEKTWSGEKRNDQSSIKFVQKVRQFWNCAPSVNPGRCVQSNTELICSYNFTYCKNGLITDLSENGYDATAINTKQMPNSIILDKSGYISLPFNSIGFPYTISIDMKINIEPGINALLFSSIDGKFFINIDGSSKCGFKREKYCFIFDCELPISQIFNFKLSCSQREIKLIINDAYVYDAINQLPHTREDSSTFVLPVEKIGVGLNIELIKLKILNKYMSYDNLLANQNYALFCKAEASSYLTNDGRFTAEKAVDGVVNRDNQLQFSKGHNQWLRLDLDQIRDINKFIITFSEHIPEYKIYISLTGEEEDWHEIYHLADGLQGVETTDIIDIPLSKARYIKYEQISMWYVESLKDFYSGGIEEFEVYGFVYEYYYNLIKQAEEKLLIMDKEDYIYIKINKIKNQLVKYLLNKRIYQRILDQLTEAIIDFIK